MREIKFRAYVKGGLPYGESGMQTVKDLISIQRGIENIHSIYVEISKEKSPYKDQDDWQIWKNDFILMQYTGIKDKNGKEIYEGDIVKQSPVNIDFHSKPVEVKWDNYSMAWVFDNQTAPHYIDDTIEVIGNRFENPELLK